MEVPIRHVLVLICLACCRGVEDDYDEDEYQRSCLGDNEFTCVSGQCIPEELFCDGKPDCRDLSDENFCPNHHTNSSTCEFLEQWMCRDESKCLPFPWICNNEQECTDGSDEVDCREPIKLAPNASCKGFKCGDGLCISDLWICDGLVDCRDKSDEYNESLCRTSKDDIRYHEMDGHNCRNFGNDLYYQCIDESYCLHSNRMCNGIKDCKDGTDEGPFCADWSKMCATKKCGKYSRCKPERTGPVCDCIPYFTPSATGDCMPANECTSIAPVCTQNCTRGDDYRIMCQCEDGYIVDAARDFCLASDPEGLLFFSTANDIRYYTLKTAKVNIAISGVKMAHGVAYDGTHIYWVETAKGHQAIMRAELKNVSDTKETIAALGLEDPGTIAIDWLGNHLYLTDSENGHITVCLMNGAVCITLNTTSRHPHLLALHPAKGTMYWADVTKAGHVIMQADMDGSNSKTLIEATGDPITSLALDIPGDRLYYASGSIFVARLDGTGLQVLIESLSHHPYSLAVFEHVVYWSDRYTYTIQATNKIHPASMKRKVLMTVASPISGIYIYHPLLMRDQPNGCDNHNCSDFCLLKPNNGHVCACAEGRALINQWTCAPIDKRASPQFLIVGAGAAFTRIRYNQLGNPESRATHFNIGKVQAMAYNRNDDILYIYDGMRKSISYLHMKDFSKGQTILLEHENLHNVVEMDYEYVTDALYFLDTVSRSIEAFSLKTNKRAIIYQFPPVVKPLSFCLLPLIGQMAVAIVLDGVDDELYVNMYGLNGASGHEILKTAYKGPRVRLRYNEKHNRIYISDEQVNTLQEIDPMYEEPGSHFRKLPSDITSIAVTDTTFFCTDRETTRLFWAQMSERHFMFRQIELSIFDSDSQLQLQTTIPALDRKNPIWQHYCHKYKPCDHVCTQMAHPRFTTLAQPNLHHFMGPKGFHCLCPRGMILANDSVTCTGSKLCDLSKGEIYCNKDDSCVTGVWCDDKNDCPLGEDEIYCDESEEDTPESNDQCFPGLKMCKGICIDSNTECKEELKKHGFVPKCEMDQFECVSGKRDCIPRWYLCDGKHDCLDGSDELTLTCKYLKCHDFEFKCNNSVCIWKQWHCDGHEDCADGSDERFCETETCTTDQFRCDNGDCIDMKGRCNGLQDCPDYSDEDQCEDNYVYTKKNMTTKCGLNEFACKLDESICIPAKARCNGKVDCPKGTDEANCRRNCADIGRFQCESDYRCIKKTRVCDGVQDCRDGSDERVYNCPLGDTTHGGKKSPVPKCMTYQCKNGECVDWKHVCDTTKDCFDFTDEGGICESACTKHNCSHTCTATPDGPQCFCPEGYHLNDTDQCVDIDECALEPCTQICKNTPGSFVCSCYPPYFLRDDGVSCRSRHDDLVIYYAATPTIYEADPWMVSYLYLYNNGTDIANVAYDVGRKLLYMSYRHGIIESNIYGSDSVASYIGYTGEISVDWVSGNVYFSTLMRHYHTIWVCNFRRQKCVLLVQMVKVDSIVALTIDPINHYIFYCTSSQNNTETAVWRATASGQNETELTFDYGNSCTALTFNSYTKRLYVANDHEIISLNYDGRDGKLLVSQDYLLRTPRNLILHDDNLYFLSNYFSTQMIKCPLYGRRKCVIYMMRSESMSSFAVTLQSVQRMVPDQCADYKCDNVCVVDSDGPKCLCADGTEVGKTGRCEANITDAAKFADYYDNVYNKRLKKKIEQERFNYHFAWNTFIIMTVTALSVALATFCYIIARKWSLVSYPGFYTRNFSRNSEDYSDEVPAVLYTGDSNEGHISFINPQQLSDSMEPLSMFGKEPSSESSSQPSSSQPSTSTRNDQNDQIELLPMKP